MKGTARLYWSTSSRNCLALATGQPLMVCTTSRTCLKCTRRCDPRALATVVWGITGGWGERGETVWVVRLSRSGGVPARLRQASARSRSPCVCRSIIRHPSAAIPRTLAGVLGLSAVPGHPSSVIVVNGGGWGWRRWVSPSIDRVGMGPMSAPRRHRSSRAPAAAVGDATRWRLLPVQRRPTTTRSIVGYMHRKTTTATQLRPIPRREPRSRGPAAAALRHRQPRP